MKKIIRYFIAALIIINIEAYNGRYAFASEPDMISISKTAESEENNLHIMSTSDSKTNLTPKYDKTSGLYGYTDKEGVWIIKPVFLDAKSFSQGLAAVLENSQAPKWGYIQPDGNFVIKPQYTAAYEFEDDYAIVTDDNRYIVTIDKKGKVKIKTKYYLGGYDAGNLRAVISDKETNMGYENIKYGAITSKGVFVKPQFNVLPAYIDSFTCFFNDDAAGNYDNRKYYLVLSDGTVKEIPGPITGVSDNVGFIEYRDSEYQLRYAYVTLSGKVMKNYKEYPFIHAEEFSEGYAAVCINTGNGNPYFDQWGFLKKDGSWLKEPFYTRAGSFVNGVAPVKIVDKWGYLKSDLTWFIKPYELSEKEQKEEADYCTSEARRILKEIINDSMSDYEKVYQIYDYITEMVEYDMQNYAENNIPRVSYSAYGVFKYHMAVCNGYANALKIMLDLAGIDNIIITGTVKTSKIGHAWNLIKIGGSYYHADATWDAGTVAWSEFLKSDDAVGKLKTWDKEAYPKAPKNYK